VERDQVEAVRESAARAPSLTVVDQLLT
jgi:hypothetical protein